jgi:hypothetical protein
MGDPPFSPVAVNALRNKRADLAGQIEMHNREIDRLRSELVHLDATLRLFDPYIQPDEIASRKRWPRRTDYFARGELTRLVFDAIREHGTTSAGELAAAAMTARSIPDTDNAIRRDFVARFLNTLHDLLRRGTVEKIGQGVAAMGCCSRNGICSCYFDSIFRV